MEQQVRERETQRETDESDRSRMGKKEYKGRQDRNRIKHNRKKKQNICRESIKWNKEQNRKQREEAEKPMVRSFLTMHRAWRSQPGHCSYMMTLKNDTEKVRNDL